MSVPTVRDVMRQIEFELAQGMVSRPDLRKTLRELRRFHETTRAAVFGEDEGHERIDLREAVSRQFQINDMLLAVLGEVAESAHEARGEARRVHRYVTEALDGIDPGHEAPPTSERGNETGASEDVESEVENLAERALSRPGSGTLSVCHGASEGSAPKAVDPLDRTPWDPELDSLYAADELDASADPEEEVEWAMRPERLWLGMDERAPRLPLVGSVLRRFRLALHTRVLIYAGQLGEKQGRVNRILGDHLLRVLEIARAQSATIDAMRLRLGRLEARARRSRQNGDR